MICECQWATPKEAPALFSPSRSALYCTISAILKSKVACISAFYPITNAVGYQAFGTGDYITTAGAAFSPINAAGKWTCDTKVFDNDVAASDVVYIFDPEVWNLNSWGFNGFDGEAKSLGWAYYYTDTETWEPADKVVASFELAKGDTVYFQPNDAVSGLTVSGQVEDTTKAAKWTLEAGEWIGDIMNPFPIATTLADLETFAKASDVIYVFNYNFWNLDSYAFNGPGLGWACYTTSDETWEAIDYVVTDTSTVVLPAGVGGCYQPNDMDGRIWTVNLK